MIVNAKNVREGNHAGSLFWLEPGTIILMFPIEWLDDVQASVAKVPRYVGTFRREV